MYIDLILFILLIILIVFFFRRFSSFIYSVVAVDILFRLLHFLADHVPVEELSNLINKYIPTDVIGMISRYVGMTGFLYTILIWIMFIIYSICLFYIIRILVRRK